MKKSVYLLVFLVLILSVIADDFVYDSDTLTIDIDVKGVMELVPESSNYETKKVIADLSFFPRDDFNQKVLDLDVIGKGDISDESIYYEWSNPSQEEFEFGFGSRIETNNDVYQIKRKIKFPIRNLEMSYEIYTQPSKIIDSGQEDIIKLASELVQGEDDLYEAVYKLGDWTNKNIEYDLSTLTVEASQPASWVLRNKEGVCDELTSLFIAMCRAVGIPARFVSGIAYTSSDLFEEEWGPHGWAEVYFPGYGFVPYDVTYGEYGFIDASHVKMKTSVDSSTSSTQYEWIGRNIDLKTKGLDIKTELISRDGKIGDFVKIDAEAIKKAVGFGSYNLIEAKVKNLKDYYVATDLYISRSNGIEVQGNHKKGVLLKPDEEKKVYWIVKVDNNLDSSYSYTFNFLINSIRNENDKTSFTSNNRNMVYSKNEIETLLSNLVEEEEKEYSKDIDLECVADKKEFYAYESTLVNCRLKNTGNVFLEDLEVCVVKECNKFDLGISQEKSYNFSLSFESVGEKEITVSAKNNQVSKFGYVSLTVLDEPSITIGEVIYPEQVEFKQEFDFVFVLERKSNSNPVKVNLIFDYNGYKRDWLIEELNENRRYVITIPGSNLKAGVNDFIVVADFEDRNGNKFNTKEEFQIELVNVSILQRIQIWLNYFGRDVINFFGFDS